MHATPDLRVVLELTIAGSGPVNVDVMSLKFFLTAKAYGDRSRIHLHNCPKVRN